MASLNLAVAAAGAAGLCGLGFYGVSKLLETKQLSPNAQADNNLVRKRTTRTYLAATGGLTVVGATACVCFKVGIASYVSNSTAAKIGLFACTSGTLWALQSVQSRETWQRGLFFTLSMGGLGVMMSPVLAAGGSLVVQAGAVTAISFAGLTAVAAVSPPGMFLSFGPPVGMGLAALAAVHLMAWMFPQSRWPHVTSLYGGLGLFAVCAAHDTSRLIHRAESAPAGEFDPFWESVDFVLDYLNLFIRILELLARKRQRRN